MKSTLEKGGIVLARPYVDCDEAEHHSLMIGHFASSASIQQLLHRYLDLGATRRLV